MEIGEILGRFFPRRRAPEIAHPMALPRDQLKPRVVIPASNSELHPSYHRSAYLDQKTLDKEVLLLETEISRVNIDPIMSSKEKEVQKQKGFIDKFWQANDFMADLENKFSEQLEKGVTVQDAQIHRVLRTGTALFMANCLRHLRTFAAGKGFEAQLTPYIDLLGYRYLGWTSIGISGISIEDMMNKKTAATLSSSSLYKFFQGSYSVKRNISHNEVLKENTGELKQEYPNITKNYIEMATADVLAAIDLPGNALDRLGTNVNTATEYIRWAKQFIDQARKLYQKPYATLLDPQSSDFPSLKQAIEVLLKQTWADRMLAVHFLGLQETSRMYNLYRKARKFAQEDNNHDFYNLLADVVLEYAEAKSSDRILTHEDVIMLINGNVENHDVPTFEDLKVIGDKAFRKSSQKEYLVDPNQIEIDRSNLIMPPKISVEFPSGNSSKIDVALHYENKDKEMLDLAIQIDTKKGKLDWSFMDSPDDPEMKRMHDAIMLATKQILLDVQKQAEKKWQERQIASASGSQPSMVAQTTNGTKPKSETPYVPREKAEKTEKEKFLTPIQEALSEAIFDPSAKKVKRHITPLKEESMQQMMNGISPENKAFIRQKIQNFNERGVGKFKALPGYITPEGKKVYELRANDYRVLLTEVSGVNGNGNNKIHEFEVYKIGNRGKVFKPRQKT